MDGQMDGWMDGYKGYNKFYEISYISHKVMVMATN